MTDAHLDPTRKQDFVFYIEARDCNPNGDPDNGGAPRVDPITGQGLISNVSVKRKVRDTVTMLNEYDRSPGNEIYIEAGTALNSQIQRAYHPDQGNAKDRDGAREWMRKNFFDVRMFGAVMSTGDQKKHAGRAHGPMVITWSRSIDPVTPLDMGITRITPTKTEDLEAFQDPDPEKKGKESEMGSQQIIPYGLYRGEGHFSAPQGAKAGVTSDDLALFWRAFTLMCDHTRSATRGDVNLQALHVFTHDDAFGRVPARKLLDRVSVKPLGEPTARNVTDYGPIDVNLDGLQGVTHKPLVA